VLNAPDEVVREVLVLEEAKRTLSKRDDRQSDFLTFVKHVYPGFIQGVHHKQVAKRFEKLAVDRGSRLIVNMPPRHTKSDFASYLLPAWLIGKNPELKIIQTTHTAELAVRFGRKVRNLMETREYREVFPDVDLRADSKAAGRWETSQGGEYYAAGVGGAITGRGADLLIIDDPHSEQDALSETPAVSYIMQSYDTAFSKKETADYSAITTWGIFKPNEHGPDSLILMDAQRGRWDFPELKAKALEEYKYWEPDMVLIEAKATGMPLTDELRNIGIPVVNYTPSKGRDKHTRMHMVAPIFESGKVWAPEKRFSEEVIDECAAFPNGDHDDYCDSMSMALIRYRKGGFLRLDTDEEDVEPLLDLRPRVYY
jgi:predicted phage terminase large subunit-like protein